MRVVIVNDTDGPHFGCQLVMESFREQLDRVGIELAGTVSKRVKSIDQYPDVVGNADLVIVNGEGSIHHGRRGELVELAARFPAVLVNCVYQENPPREELKEFRYISARESRSAAELARHGVCADVVPDVLMTNRRLCGFQGKDPLRDIGVTDNVLDEIEGVRGFCSAKPGPGKAMEYLHWMGQHRRLCVGRFHAAIAAAVMGIPFAAFPSNTHKLNGLMEDMGVANLLGDNRDGAMGLIPDECDACIAEYVTQGQQTIDRLFEGLHDLV